MPRPVGHSGHSSAGGRKVRFSRCAGDGDPVAGERVQPHLPGRGPLAQRAVVDGVAGLRAGEPRLGVVEVDDLPAVGEGRRRPAEAGGAGRRHAGPQVRAGAAWCAAGGGLARRGLGGRCRRRGGRRRRGGGGDHELADLLADRAPCGGVEVGVGDQDVDLVQRGDGGQPDDAPLAVVGHHEHAPRGRDEGPVGLGLDQVGGGQARPLVDAVHAEDQRVDVQRAQRGDGDRAGQGVRGGAHPAGEDHREVVAGRVVQQLGHAGGVGDDGQVGDVAQLVRDRVGGGAGRDGDRGARVDHRRGGAGDRGLLHRVHLGLDLEARLVRAPAADRGGAAVDLADQPLLGQRLDVTAHRHVGDAEDVDQLGDARPTVAVDLVQDPLLTLTCKHGQLPRRRSRQQIAALDQTHSNTIHRLGHARGGGAGRPAAPTEGPLRPATHGGRARGERGATRGATSVADLTQWRACPRTTTPLPPPSRASCRACSRRTTRCTSATTSARWSTGSALQDDPRRVLLRRRPARHHRRGRARAAARAHPPHRRPVPRRRCRPQAVLGLRAEPRARARAAGLGALAASPASARPAG